MSKKASFTATYLSGSYGDKVSIESANGHMSVTELLCSVPIYRSPGGSVG